MNNNIVTSIFMAAILGSLFVVFTHNFVTEHRVYVFSLYASLLLTICSIVILVYLYINELWFADFMWSSYTMFERAIVIIFGPLLLYGLFWLNLGISIPQLFTLAFGSDAIKHDVVVKDINYSGRSCKYRLEPKSIDAIFFHYCISESFYNQLTDAEIESQLFVKQSVMGYLVEDILIYPELHR